MEISVVIPAFNEEAHILACLVALQAQTLPEESYEIIVVDNGSTDGTVRIASSFANGAIVRVLSQPKSSIAAARNAGAALANGKLLAFLDADCMTRPTWLEDGCTLAQGNTVWGAHYLVPADATWVGKTWFRYQATRRVGPVSFIPASCLFLARRDFERLGGFNSSIEASEDVELCTRARESGMQIMALTSLAVVHEGTPRTLIHFYRQNRWHGKQVLRIFLAHLPSIRNLPLIALTFYTLLMFFATIVLLLFDLGTGHWFPITILVVLLLLLPSLLLTLKNIARSNFLPDAPALFVLYLTYFFARSDALTRSLFRYSTNRPDRAF